MNKFCPLSSSSDDLFLYFCIYPSSMEEEFQPLGAKVLKHLPHSPLARNPLSCFISVKYKKCISVPLGHPHCHTATHTHTHTHPHTRATEPFPPFHIYSYFMEVHQVDVTGSNPHTMSFKGGSK